jgi:hypothetical protein
MPTYAGGAGWEMMEEASGEYCWEGVSTPSGKDSTGGADAVHAVMPQLRGRRESDSDIELPEGCGSPVRAGIQLAYADVC